MTARSIQVTLGSGATQIATTQTVFNEMFVQNNAAHVCRVGDSTVSSTKGQQLAASGAVNSTLDVGPIVGSQGDASQFWIAGTSGDVIDVLLW